MKEINIFENIDESYKDYETYEHLIVCSNQLVKTNHILRTKSDWVPLSVRKGESPRVWLSAATEFDSQGNPTKCIDLIVNSDIKNNLVQFTSTEYGFKVVIDNTTVVEAGNHNKGSLEIIKIDLRPIGLNIFGDITGLKVGGMTLTRGSANNSDVFVGI